MKNDDRPRNYRKDTLLTHLGRNPEAQHGAINPPVYHASTILSKNVAEWENRRDPRLHFGVVRYGLSGTPTTFALEELLAKIEGGIDVSIHAATKHNGGDSDAMLGAVITNEASWLPVRSIVADLGHCAGPDDIFFGLRGMRTLSVRLERHQKNALEVAHWLQTCPEVTRVLYPALAEDPGHA